MTKLRINKIDAARQQLDAAIRMTFGEENPVAIHTVVAAAHRIVRDICEQRGDIESYLRFTDWIAPGHENEFWQHWNASANFLKHADQDADNIHELDYDVTDFLIVITSKWYRDLGNSPSPEMRAFTGWWAMQNPNVLKPEFLATAGISNQFSAIATAMSQLSRQDRARSQLAYSTELVRRELHMPGAPLSEHWETPLKALDKSNQIPPELALTRFRCLGDCQRPIGLSTDLELRLSLLPVKPKKRFV